MNYSSFASQIAYFFSCFWLSLIFVSLIVRQNVCVDFVLSFFGNVAWQKCFVKLIKILQMYNMVNFEIKNSILWWVWRFLKFKFNWVQIHMNISVFYIRFTTLSNSLVFTNWTNICNFHYITKSILYPLLSHTNDSGIVPTSPSEISNHVVRCWENQEQYCTQTIVCAGYFRGPDNAVGGVLVCAQKMNIGTRCVLNQSRNIAWDLSQKCSRWPV